MPLSWLYDFYSQDQLPKSKSNKMNLLFQLEKESIITTEDESSRKVWSKKTTLNSPAKNLRFFGDTDPDSDANLSHSAVTKSKSHPQSKTHGAQRKPVKNSTNGMDEVDNSMLSSKSYSLSNLHRDENRDLSARPAPKYKRNLQNITEHNAEADSRIDRRIAKKPPINPYDRSRSQSSSKTLKGERRSGERGSAADVRRRVEERGSSSELRGSKPEVNRDLK